MTVASPSTSLAARIAPRLTRNVTLVRSMLSNPLNLIPPDAYEKPVVRVSAFGRDTVCPTRPCWTPDN